MSTHTIQPLIEDLVKARKRQQISQSQLSERLGLRQSYISQIEQGRRDIRTSTLIDMGRLLGFEVMLVPRSLVTTVAHLTRDAGSDRYEETPAYRATGDQEG